MTLTSGYILTLLLLFDFLSNLYGWDQPLKRIEGIFNLDSAPSSSKLTMAESSASIGIMGNTPPRIWWIKIDGSDVGTVGSQ